MKIRVLVSLAVLTFALGTMAEERFHEMTEFDKPAFCGSCHVDIARQHEQAMMAQSYTHHWDRSSTSSSRCRTQTRSRRSRK
jgi:hypothetical protein